VKADLCERPLLEVLLEPHATPNAPAGAGPTLEEWGRTWPVEQERVYVRDASTLTGWRLWEQRDFERYRHWHALTAEQRDVWVSAAASVAGGSKLPPPAWPAADAQPPLGGPGGICLPGKLRGWARCGAWRGGARTQHGVTTYHGCPPVWAQRGVSYAHDPAHRNLLGLPWEEKKLMTDLLLLCEDGSHGLDLSFVTHLFLVNHIRDPAKLQQVISRAHRMGATGPVLVQTLHMWND